MNHAEFKRKTYNFQNCRELLFFLLNILLIIKDNGDRFCCCVFPIECLISKVKRIYANYKFDLYKNMFNLDFFY